jgi:hypothetical protein
MDIIREIFWPVGEAESGGAGPSSWFWGFFRAKRVLVSG